MPTYIQSVGRKSYNNKNECFVICAWQDNIFIFILSLVCVISSDRKMTISSIQRGPQRPRVAANWKCYSQLCHHRSARCFPCPGVALDKCGHTSACVCAFNKLRKNPEQSACTGFSISVCFMYSARIRSAPATQNPDDYPGPMDIIKRETLITRSDWHAALSHAISASVYRSGRYLWCNWSCIRHAGWFRGGV